MAASKKKKKTATGAIAGAKPLRLELAAVRSRIHRGRRMLRAALTAEGAA